MERGEVVNVYSDFLRADDEVLFDAFEQQTGLRVNLIIAKAEHIWNRLEDAPDSTTADLFMLKGISQLQKATRDGLLDSIPNVNLLRMIPEHLRDDQNLWTTMAYNVYGITYRTDSVDSIQLRSYADLSAGQWQEKLALEGNVMHYQSLVAAMLADQGREATENWLRGLEQNVQAAGSRQLDSSLWLKLTDTKAYFLEAGEKKADVPQAFLFPATEAYLQIMGVGIYKEAPHPERARRLLAYLLSREVMRQTAEQWQAYPASSEVAIPAALQQLSSFQPDTTAQSIIGRYAEEAADLLRRLPQAATP